VSLRNRTSTVAPPSSVDVSTEKPLFGVAQLRLTESPRQVSCAVPPISAKVRVSSEGCCGEGGAGDRGGDGVAGTTTGVGDVVAVGGGLGETGGVLVTGLAEPAPAGVEVSGSR